MLNRDEHRFQAVVEVASTFPLSCPSVRADASHDIVDDKIRSTSESDDTSSKWECISRRISIAAIVR